MRDQRKYAEQSAAWLRRYLAPLKGATIIAAGATVNSDSGFPEAWPKFVVKAKDGTTFDIEVSQDEEGNGPGFLFGLPMPDPIKEESS